MYLTERMLDSSGGSKDFGRACGVIAKCRESQSTYKNKRYRDNRRQPAVNTSPDGQQDQCTGKPRSKSAGSPLRRSSNPNFGLWTSQSVGTIERWVGRASLVHTGKPMSSQLLIRPDSGDRPRPLTMGPRRYRNYY